MPLPLSSTEQIEAAAQSVQEALDARADSYGAPEVQSRLDRLASLTGQSATSVKRLTVDLRKLANGAIAGELSGYGGNALLMTLNLKDLGIDNEEKIVTITSPRISLLPAKTVERLRFPLQSARVNWMRHSFHVQACDPLVGSGVRFLLFPSWRPWFTEHTRLLTELETAKQEAITQHATNTALVQQEALKLAQSSLQALHAKRVYPEEGFVERFVASVTARIPSPDWIQSNIKIVFTPAILELLSEAIAERQAAEAHYAAARDVRAEITAFYNQAVQETLSTMVSPLVSMLDEWRTNVRDVLDTMAERLSRRNAVTKTDLQGLERIYQDLEAISAVMGEVKGREGLRSALATTLVQSLTLHMTRDEATANQLKTAITTLRSAVATVVPLYTAETGANYVDL